MAGKEETRPGGIEMERVEIIAIVGSLGLFIGIFELVRNKLLKEKYSLIWLFTALVLLLLSVFRNLMDKLANMVGIYYSPSAFFLLAFVFLMVIMVQFSVVISRLSERNKALGQEIALLKLRLEEMEETCQK
jgi:hypothetical protein